MCLLPTASMKPHCLVNQLLWALVLVDVVDLNEVLQDLQPRQEISWLLSASLLLLLFTGNCQNLHTCWVSLCNCKETMP